MHTTTTPDHKCPGCGRSTPNEESCRYRDCPATRAVWRKVPGQEPKLWDGPLSKEEAAKLAYQRNQDETDLSITYYVADYDGKRDAVQTASGYHGPEDMQVQIEAYDNGLHAYEAQVFEVSVFNTGSVETPLAGVTGEGNTPDEAIQDALVALDDYLSTQQQEQQ